MMSEIKINNNDLLIMNLVHYFITEKNYNPVVLHGITDEIWLENLDSDYKIIRIVSRYIHNNEQLNFDKFKLKKIVDNLKKKTFSLKMSVVNIYTSLGDAVDLDINKDNELNFFISTISEIKNPTLIEIFPDIVEKTNHKEKGIDLFVKISDDINKESFEKSKRVEKIFSPKTPIVTYTIIGICVVMFLISLLMGGGDIFSINLEALYNLGASNKLAVKHGELYRLFTCIFLHAGIIHIMCNMYSLYVIGPQVESFFGKLKFIFIFCFSGICGSLLSLVFVNDPNIISIGASGAIFGLLGAILYFGYHYRVYLGNALKSQIIPVIILNLMIGFMVVGIDNYAHIGGLIGGVFASMAVGVPDKNTTSEKASGCVVMLMYLAFIIYMVFFK